MKSDLELWNRDDQLDHKHVETKRKLYKTNWRINRIEKVLDRTKNELKGLGWRAPVWKQDTKAKNINLKI